MKKKLINRENYTEAMGKNLYENWKLEVRYSDHTPVNARFFSDLCIEASHVKENCDFIRTVLFPAEFCLVAGYIGLCQTEQGQEILEKTGIDPIIRMGIIIVILSLPMITPMTIPAMADTVLVLQNGNRMEYGPAKSVLEHPRNEYTKELLSAVPKLRRS